MVIPCNSGEASMRGGYRCVYVDFDPNRGGGIQEGWSALVYAGGEQTRARESSLNLL